MERASGSASGETVGERVGECVVRCILDEGNDVAVLNLGSRLQSCREAIKILNTKGIYPTLADARFAKPLDENLIWQIANNHESIITIEEGTITGGFGDGVD